jgi:hypothetical protein
MSKTVFILGAGASAAARAPVMANFMDAAEDLLFRDCVGAEKEYFELVFRARSRLQAVYSKALIDLDNLEALFVAFEMADLLGKALGELGQDVVSRLGEAMRHVITRTLAETMPYRNDGEYLQPPEPYYLFAQGILKECEETPGSVSVVTFNYDCAIDYALAYAGIATDYCLECGPSKKQPTIDLMKLHGSLNWLRKGKEVEPIPIQRRLLAREFDRKYSPSDSSLKDPNARIMNAAARVALERTGRPDLEAVEICIVPPTWSKGEHHKGLRPVWQHAAQHLSKAERIVVVGYSLPPTDEFFRYLFALGTMSDTTLKSFLVFDKGASEELDQRFRRLLGPRALCRYAMGRCDFCEVASEYSTGWKPMEKLLRARPIR